jgi:hypothetical protein
MMFRFTPKAPPRSPIGIPFQEPNSDTKTKTATLQEWQICWVFGDHRIGDEHSFFVVERGRSVAESPKIGHYRVHYHPPSATPDARVPPAGLGDKGLLQPGQTALRRADQILHRWIGGAHLGQHRFGRHAPVHQPDPARLAVLPLDPIEKAAQRRVVGSVAWQDLVGERKPFRRHDLRNDHLHAVAAVVARIAVPTLVA